MRHFFCLSLVIASLLVAACGKSDGGGSSFKTGSPATCTSDPGSQGSCKSPYPLTGDATAPATSPGWVDDKPSFYTFAAVPGSYYRIGLSGYSGDLDLYVFDRSGFQDSDIVCVSARSSTAPESCLVQARSAEMFVGVLNNDGTYQPFQLSRQPVDAPEALGTENDPFDLGTTPTSFAGTVDDGASFFRVTVATGGIYTVSLAQMDGDADLYVSSESFTTASTQTAPPPGSSCTSLNYYTADESCQVTVTGDTLYIGIDGSYANAGATFALTVKKTGGAYANEGSAENPIKVNLNETREGEVDTESFYWVETQPGHIYRFTASYSAVPVHDDDASFASSSVICDSCYMQASGNAVYFRAVNYGYSEKISIKVTEHPLDQPIPEVQYSSAPILHLARGVVSYTGLINLVDNSPSAYGDAAFAFRSVPGTFYRITIDPKGIQISPYAWYSASGGCGYALDAPGLQYCIVEADSVVTGIFMQAWADVPMVAEVGLSIEQIETPVVQGTLAEPVDLGDAPGSFAATVTHKGYSYYRIHATPGVTYSVKATSAEITGCPPSYNCSIQDTAKLSGYISDGGAQNLYSTCCVFTPGTNSIILALSPSYAGGTVQIVVTANDGTYPAEGIVGGPVVLDPLGDSHRGTVSVDHSSYVFQSVKDQLYGISITDPTNPGVRATATSSLWYGYGSNSCVAKEGLECRFYGPGGPIAIAVTGGPAAYTLNLYPTQLPPNEGTAIDPVLLTLPVAYRGSVGYEESYYKVALDPHVRYKWWVSTIDGGAYGWFYGGSPGQVINCGWAAMPCSVSGRSALYIYVDGDSLGAHFMLYVEPQ